MKAIDFEVTLKNTKDDVKKLYQIVRPAAKLEEIEYSEFAEGVINSIVQLSDPLHKDPIVIRTYMLKMLATKEEGETLDLEKFQNRKLELAALKKASELGITVDLLATYTNGFIYRFIDGEQNKFELYDIETTAKQTAIKMARLHAMQVPGASKDPIVYKFLDRSTFAEWTKDFAKKQAESKHEELRSVIPLFPWVDDEYERLHNLVLEADAYGPICFCHNDLNETNLLIDRQTKEPIFIDFEWSDTNFQMHDISYHLCNMGGRFIQYWKPEHVPNAEFIRRWLTFYYEEAHKLANVRLSESQFKELIELELKKVLVNMLLIRLLLISRAMFFELGQYDAEKSEGCKDYMIGLWNDFVKHKDEHLALLDTLKK